MPLLYLETNFLIAYAKGQDNAHVLFDCAGALPIVMPSVCVMEAATRLESQRIYQNALTDRFAERLREAKRDKTSPNIGVLVHSLEQTILANEKVHNDMETRLREGLRRLADRGTELVHMSFVAIRDPVTLGLPPSPTDRLILACILEDAAHRSDARRAFLSGDKEAFGQDEVREVLDRSGVRHHKSVDGALGWLSAAPHPDA